MTFQALPTQNETRRVSVCPLQGCPTPWRHNLRIQGASPRSSLVLIVQRTSRVMGKCATGLTYKLWRSCRGTVGPEVSRAGTYLTDPTHAFLNSAPIFPRVTNLEVEDGHAVPRRGVLHCTRKTAMCLPVVSADRKPFLGSILSPTHHALAQVFALGCDLCAADKRGAALWKVAACPHCV